VFSSNRKLGNFLRLSFAHYGVDDIREGISRIRSLFQ
jgi:DNA-binding transcriptional MocR family regulator